MFTSLALSADRVYVADAANKTVWAFDLNGELTGKFDGRTAGEAGFIVPSPCFDVAIGTDDTLWIVNPGRRRLENYRRADGELLWSWGKSGSDIAGFCGCCNPTHIAIGRDGTFITAEKGLCRVKIYNPDGTLRGVIAEPSGFQASDAVADLAVDAAGRIAVLDANRKAVRIFEIRGLPNR